MGPGPDEDALRAPVPGTVVAIEAGPGVEVTPGEEVVVLEAMKMEHVVALPAGGTVRRIAVAVGDTVRQGQLLATVAHDPDGEQQATAELPTDLDEERADLAEVRRRHEQGLDAHRTEAVARRHAAGRRTARENLADLVDPGSFLEYGPLHVGEDAAVTHRQFGWPRPRGLCPRCLLVTLVLCVRGVRRARASPVAPTGCGSRSPCDRNRTGRANFGGFRWEGHRDGPVRHRFGAPPPGRRCDQGRGRTGRRISVREPDFAATTTRVLALCQRTRVGQQRTWGGHPHRHHEHANIPQAA